MLEILVACRLLLSNKCYVIDIFDSTEKRHIYTLQLKNKSNELHETRNYCFSISKCIVDFVFLNKEDRRTLHSEHQTVNVPDTTWIQKRAQGHKKLRTLVISTKWHWRRVFSSAHSITQHSHFLVTLFKPHVFSVLFTFSPPLLPTSSRPNHPLS